jgi:hypothetical protein
MVSFIPAREASPRQILVQQICQLAIQNSDQQETLVSLILENLAASGRGQIKWLSVLNHILDTEEYRGILAAKQVTLLCNDNQGRK